jgi:predicted metal-binding membrane protein
MWATRTDARLFGLVAALLVAVAWLALLVWGRSPYGSYLNHEGLDGLDFGLSAEYVRRLLLFVAAWSLMTVAMMLPTSLPLIMLFRRITQQRAERNQLMLLLLGGYLGVWVSFGALAHLADFGIHESVASWHWLYDHAWFIAAAPLLLAGAYQFSALKYRCLDECRSPFSFVMSHWRGPNPRLQALRLGVHHGIFCVGCCWSLMLLMFAVGLGNLAWMLALATVMAVEKNLPWGRRLSAPLGVVLLTAGVTVLVLGSAQGVACAC